MKDRIVRMIYHRPMTKERTLPEVVFASARELRDTLAAFLKAPRAVWGVNIANVIEGLVYFGILTILGKFCSENVGLSDIHSGWVYGGVTGGITFAMVFLGGLSDRIGVRRSLILSFAVMLAGRVLVSLAGTLSLGPGLSGGMFWLMSAGLLLMVLAYGVFQPATYAAIKHYATPETAAVAYAVLYGGMNLGSFLCGFVSPITRRGLESAFPPNGLAAVFWVYAGLTLISLLTVTVLLARSRVAGAAGNDEPALAPQGGFLATVRSYLAAFSDARFVFFICILIPVQTLFAHNWLTIPYYLDRAFAGTTVGENYEFFSNLNPLIIFLLSPIVAAMTARLDVYRVMIWGTLVMAAPTFLLAFGPNVYLFLTFILLMSVGEAIWSPRFLQWIAEIAPPGKVGMYQGIGQLPWFLTKMLTSAYSGWFVANYCPKPDSGLPINTGAMWLIYAFIAMVSPIGLVLARRWMEKGSLASHAGAPVPETAA
ncbi:MAG TPA: MFS transporter [Elusimicrobia bacterium]|nr:MFS transporter [Elusimicrobiota bacterium]